MIYGNKKQIRTPQRPSHTVKPTRKKQTAACTTRRPRRMVISIKKHKREKEQKAERLTSETVEGTCIIKLDAFDALLLGLERHLRPCRLRA